MLENRHNASLPDLEMGQLSEFEQSTRTLFFGDLNAEHGAILREWTAQDFANLYTRLRPHLIGYARKFLPQETQAEEVVQDAFLYLMTALPELDSELGVMRFLKWKTKMLSLDTLRASRSGLSDFLEPLQQEVADERNQPSEVLEKADDAAIVRLALSKINPRHREALIATLYEEKSHEEAAHQMGLSENAFRQLLFRARASFRKALVGEAEVDGKTVAEILSLAARKASALRGSALASLLVLSGLAILPLLSSTLELQENPTLNARDSLSPLELLPETPVASERVQQESTQADAVVVEIGTATPNVPNEEPEVRKEIDQTATEKTKPRDIAETNEDEARLSRDAFSQSLDENLVIKLASEALAVSHVEGQLTATNEAGLTANFAVDLNSHNIVQYLFVEFKSGSQVWKAVPENSISVVDQSEDLTYVSFAATDFLVGDFTGAYDFVSTSDSVFSRSGIKLDFVIDDSGEIKSAEVAFLPKT